MLKSPCSSPCKETKVSRVSNLTPFVPVVLVLKHKPDLYPQPLIQSILPGCICKERDRAVLVTIDSAEWSFQYELAEQWWAGRKGAGI